MKIITKIDICNPMSCSGDNYREILDERGILNFEPCLLSWKYNFANSNMIFIRLNELIDISPTISENGL